MQEWLQRWSVTQFWWSHPRFCVLPKGSFLHFFYHKLHEVPKKKKNCRHGSVKLKLVFISKISLHNFLLCNNEKSFHLTNTGATNSNAFLYEQTVPYFSMGVDAKLDPPFGVSNVNTCPPAAVCVLLRNAPILEFNSISIRQKSKQR